MVVIMMVLIKMIECGCGCDSWSVDEGVVI